MKTSLLLVLVTGMFLVLTAGSCLRGKHIVGSKNYISKEVGNNEITLFNGCVEFNVEATGKQIVMKPMEKIFYNSVNAEIGIRKIENIEWQDGKFKFDAMPLNRLISIINQMYHANIVYEGKDETSPFSGTIRQEEALDDIILKICFLMNLKEERVGNTIIIRN